MTSSPDHQHWVTMSNHVRVFPHVFDYNDSAFLGLPAPVPSVPVVQLELVFKKIATFTTRSSIVLSEEVTDVSPRSIVCAELHRLVCTESATLAFHQLLAPFPTDYRNDISELMVVALAGFLSRAVTNALRAGVGALVVVFEVQRVETLVPAEEIDDYNYGFEEEEEFGNNVVVKEVEEFGLERSVWGNVDEEEQCVVCMEEFELEKSQVSRMFCGHVFHAGCIAKWLTLKASCPVCRFQLERP